MGLAMTIYDIAAELHISPATVSLALNGDSRVAQKTRLRVTEFATNNGFTRNEQALRLPTPKFPPMRTSLFRGTHKPYCKLLRKILPQYSYTGGTVKTK